MTRASNGTYTLDSSQPVTTLETISSSEWNDTFSDIATEMTDSLSRSAKGAMLDQLKLLAADTKTAPGLTWDGDLTSGYYHAGAGDLGVSIADTDLWRFSAASADLTGALTISSTLGVTGASTFAAVTATTGVFSSTLNAAVGSVGAPAYSFTAHTGTGMYHGGVDGDLNFASKGVLKFQIDGSNGFLAISTGSKITNQDGTAALPAYSFTSAPSNGLSLVSSSLILSTGGTAALTLNSSQESTFAGAMTVAANSRVENASGPAFITNRTGNITTSDVIGRVDFLGDDSTSDNIGARIRVQASGVWTGGSDHPTSMLFQTDNSGTITTAMTIDSNQDATFAGDVDVTGSIFSNDDTSSTAISGGSSGSTGANILMYGGSTVSTANDFSIRTGTDAVINYDSSLETFRINSEGGSATAGASLRLYGGLGGSLADDILLRSNNVDIIHYDASSDDLVLYAGGSTAVTLDTSGDIVIDTATNIESSASNGSLTISGGASEESGGFIRLYGPTGGIPDSLELGTSTVTALTIDSNQDATFAQDVFLSRSGNPKLEFYDLDTNVISGDPIGIIRFSADDSGTQNPGASISVSGDGTWGTNDYPTKLVFLTDQAGTLTEAMRIDSNQDTTFSGDILAGTGTAGDPAIAWSGSPTTGMYERATNEIGLSCAGTEIFVIDANGVQSTGRVLVTNELNLVTSALTIATGAVTVTKSYHTLISEGGTGVADSLTTLTGGGEGDILVLRSDDSTSDITVSNGTTIRLAGGVDFILDHTDDALVLLCISVNNWIEISRSDNS